MFYRDDQSAKTEADAVFQKFKIIVNIFNYEEFSQEYINLPSLKFFTIMFIYPRWLRG